MSTAKWCVGLSCIALLVSCEQATHPGAPTPSAPESATAEVPSAQLVTVTPTEEDAWELVGVPPSATVDQVQAWAEQAGIAAEPVISGLTPLGPGRGINRWPRRMRWFWPGSRTIQRTASNPYYQGCQMICYAYCDMKGQCRYVCKEVGCGK